MLLSKKQYSDWREIQDEFAEYVTSLGPWTEQEVIGFLRDDFSIGSWPFSEEQIKAFVLSTDETIATLD